MTILGTLRTVDDKGVVRMHLAGGDRCDAATRFGELHPAYRDLAANLG